MPARAARPTAKRSIPSASLTTFGMRSRKAGSTYSSHSARGSTTCASESIIFAIVVAPSFRIPLPLESA